MAIHALWVEQYRPTTVDEYVFKDPQQKKIIEGWIAEKSIPHLLLHGGPGTGKTTLARVLVNELGIQDADFMYINASRDNGVDLIRDRVTRFSSTMAWGDFKIVLLDEADYISPNGQAALRGVMEEYSSVVRFILTCNYAHKIIPAIKSRSQEFYISNQDQSDFTARVAEILITENVEIDLETIDLYVRATYPDLRKTINAVQQNVTNGKLMPPDAADSSTSDWRLQMVALFRNKKLRAARDLICRNATPEDFEDMFKFLYRNLDFFGATPEQQDKAIMIIRDGMVKHVSVADPEINFSATMCELENI
jgi:replication factor C small subunit